MRTLIITGGWVNPEFAKGAIAATSWDLVVAADAGLDFCREAEVKPDIIIGDFDSADREALAFFKDECPDKFREFPPEKDETDTRLALDAALEAGADEIVILGATGTRVDHMLGNIGLLKYAMDRGVDCRILDECNRIRMIKEPLEMAQRERFGKFVSLIPVTPTVEGLTLKGFAYDAREITLSAGTTRGISNEIWEETAYISFDSGELLVIESQD